MNDSAASASPDSGASGQPDVPDWLRVDTDPLSWVLPEITGALDHSLEALRRFAAQGDDAADALRAARMQLHQVHGALRLIDLAGLDVITDSAEKLYALFEQSPQRCDTSAIETVGAAFRAVSEHLEVLLESGVHQPLHLYPAYRTLLQLLGAERIHPADLFFPNLSVRPPRPASTTLASAAPTLEQIGAARGRYERSLLRFLRDGDAGAAGAMRDVVLAVEQHVLAHVADTQQRAFWWVAGAFFDALEARSLVVDLNIKRLCARINQQMRRLIEGAGAVAERLLRDTLFFVALAPDVSARQHDVRRAYRLAGSVPADFETERYGRIDIQAWRQARNLLTSAKTAWTALANGSRERLDDYARETAALRSVTAALAVPGLLRIADALAGLGDALKQAARLPDDQAALEVASAMLFLETALDSLRTLDASFDARATQVAERLHAIGAGQPLPHAAEPWFGELMQRAQERITMTSFAAEMRGNLQTVEKILDAFFDDPAQRDSLPQTANLLGQTGGALAMLGHDQAAQAIASVRAALQAYADPAVAGDLHEFERIAQTLGAVGFFIDHLQHGTAAGRIFRFDPETGALTAELRAPAGQYDQDEAEGGVDDGLEPVAASDAPSSGIGALADNVPDEASFEQKFAQLGDAARRQIDMLEAAPQDTQARESLANILSRMQQDAVLLDHPAARDRAAAALKLLNHAEAAILPAALSAELAGHIAELASLASQLAPATDATVTATDVTAAGDLTVTPGPAPDPGAQSTRAAELVPEPAPQAEIDAELLEIFLSEADEVLAQARAALDGLRVQAASREHLATIRRAFHTLKGSGRMVGLQAFGDAAWAMEQTLNEWLADSRAATADLLALIDTACGFMGTWATDLATRGQSASTPGALMVAAEAVRAGAPFAWEDAAVVSVDVPADGLADVSVDVPAHPSFELPVEIAAEAPVAYQAAPPADTPSVTLPSEITLPEDTPAEAPYADIAPTEASLPGVPVSEAPDAEVLHTDVSQTGFSPPEVSPFEAQPTAYPDEQQGLAEQPAQVIPFAAPAAPRPEEFKQIGTLTLSVPLYNIYLTEADELLRVLTQDFGEWRHELHRGPSDAAIRAAHSLSGTSATIGLKPVHELAHAIDAVLQSLLRHPAPIGAEEIDVLDDAIEGLRAMLHRFAAEVAPDADFVRMANLETLRGKLKMRHDAQAELASAIPSEIPAPAAPFDDSFDDLTSMVAMPPATAAAVVATPRSDIPPVQDDIDPDLLEIFIEEATESLAQIAASLRQWQGNPDDSGAAQALMRQLHTIKGSARMAGAMRLGELTHNMETHIESAMLRSELPQGFFDELLAEHDRGLELFEQLQHPGQVAPGAAVAPAGEATAPAFTEPLEGMESTLGTATPTHAAPGEFIASAGMAATDQVAASGKATVSMLRVRADTLDRLVNQSGEVSIARSRLENELGQIKTSLSDLTENLERLRGQLREIEIQAESQMQSHLSHAREQEQFDPLEFDRFTRLQELTRMMAESVDDVATVQQNLLKSLGEAQRDLGTQQRMTRDMQQELMRVRMVPFASVSERLYRVVRRAAKELDKRVNLDIRGGHVEIDRGVLERMVGPFEHLLRNAVVHGIEARAARRAAGKDETGELLVEVQQEGNEILLTFSDDGGGLDLARIRERARAAGLIGATEDIPDNRAAELIFRPGFSTAEAVTELAGRGVGMDVVRAEAGALGGRVTVEPLPVGTRFTITLPLTLAVTQVVLVNVGGRLYALPAAIVEQMQQLRPQPLAQAYAAGHIEWLGQPVDLCFLASLLGEYDRSPIAQRYSPVLILRSAGTRIAVHVDEVVGNQEVVVKNIGPQLARLSGIVGATILPSGEIVLIINPAQLIRRTRRDEPGSVQQRFSGTPAATIAENLVNVGAASALATLPLVMVVDDSLTVRRVTQRLLSREGYQVVLAKDGVDALQQLQDYTPDVMLVDIEMPRMDGFDLTRNVRNDPRYKDIPIIMITSRTADKHRNHALELGVNVYLGKPYREDELLGYVATFTADKRRPPVA